MKALESESRATYLNGAGVYIDDPETPRSFWIGRKLPPDYVTRHLATLELSRVTTDMNSLIGYKKLQKSKRRSISTIRKHLDEFMGFQYDWRLGS